MNFSNIVIGGHLGKDATIMTTQTGLCVTRFSVGVNTGYGDRRVTNWYECAIWGDRGTKIAQYLTKGKAVIVTGEFNSTSREHQGRIYTSLNINVDNLSFAGGKDEQQTPQQPQQSEPQTEPYQAEFTDNDVVPF